MSDRPSVNRLSRPSEQVSRFWGEVTVPGIEEDRFDGQSRPDPSPEPGVSQRIVDHRGRLHPGDVEAWATRSNATSWIYKRPSPSRRSSAPLYLVRPGLIVPSMKKAPTLYRILMNVASSEPFTRKALAQATRAECERRGVPFTHAEFERVWRRCVAKRLILRFSTARTDHKSRTMPSREMLVGNEVLRLEVVRRHFVVRPIRGAAVYIWVRDLANAGTKIQAAAYGHEAETLKDCTHGQVIVVRGTRVKDGFIRIARVLTGATG